MAFVEFPGAVQVKESRWYNRDSDRYHFTDRAPVLMVHTVEGRMGRSAIGAHRSPPHLWLDPLPDYRDIFQTVDLSEPARALRNIAGYAPQTNRRGIMIQWELQLFADPKRRDSARHVSALTDDDLRWLADQAVLVDEIVRTIDPQGRGVIPASADQVPEMGPGDQGYGLRSKWRLSADEFMNYRGGILGHAHSPDDSHYDPSGDFPMTRFVEFCIAAKTGTRPVSKQVLRRGVNSPTVGRWQKLANKVFDVRLAVDNDFGPLTADATRTIQGWLEIPVTGEVDQSLVDVVQQLRDDQDAGRADRPWRPKPEEPKVTIGDNASAVAAIRAMRTHAVEGVKLADEALAVLT